MLSSSSAHRMACGSRALVLLTWFAFVAFEEVLATTRGGPGEATWVAITYSYKRSFAPPLFVGIGAAWS